jgi:D-inositol-3-phosphate glycosyltransferase
MVRCIWVLAYIDDPLDPPGEGRLGGGQSFIFDLGRCFVRQGFDVTYVTQLNDQEKSEFERLGPRCRLHRIRVGEARYKIGEELGYEIDELTEKTLNLAREHQPIDLIHAQYWVSGAVAIKLKAEFGSTVFLYPLSFGRGKRTNMQLGDRLAVRREEIEPGVLEACDHIVVGTPEERQILRNHYPEIRDEQILLAPLWNDAIIFHPRPEPADHYVRRSARRFTEGI